jgi:DNA-binding NarL/FixJ family response regulator
LPFGAAIDWAEFHDGKSMPCPLILLVEDHPMMAHALQSSLAAVLRGSRFLQANSAAEGLEAIKSQPIDLLLLDLHLPDSKGLDTLNLFCAYRPTGPMMVYSMMHEKVLINACIANRVSYVCKSEPSVKLIDMVLESLNDLSLSTNTVHEVPTEPLQANKHPTFGCLSTRQLHVLSKLAQGLSGPEIALQLGVEQSTVRTHLHDIYRRLGVKNKTQAASLYWQWIRQFGEPYD